jgi:hypothetical protein
MKMWSKMYVLCRKMFPPILQLSCLLSYFQLGECCLWNLFWFHSMLWISISWRTVIERFYSELGSLQGNILVELQFALPQSQEFIKVYTFFQSVEADKFPV